MRTKLTACALIAAIAVTGCANMTEKQKTTTTGAGIGAVAGAAIGALTGPGGWGRAAVGAAIGGLLGGGGGYLWGNHMEKQKQDCLLYTSFRFVNCLFHRIRHFIRIQNGRSVQIPGRPTNSLDQAAFLSLIHILEGFLMRR